MYVSKTYIAPIYTDVQNISLAKYKTFMFSGKGNPPSTETLDELRGIADSPNDLIRVKSSDMFNNMVGFLIQNIG